MDENLKQLLMPALLAANCTVIVVMGIMYYRGVGSMLLQIFTSVAVGAAVGGVTFFVMKSKR
jgi:hypothetical protein